MKFRKIILVLLVMFFLLAVVPAFALAGSGTETDPYQISNLDDLVELSEDDTLWDNYFIQTADIDASETISMNDSLGFSPIGYDENISFTGTYNGQGFVINNLYIDRPTSQYIGLFGYINNAIIINLGVINASVKGKQQVGILAGRATGTHIGYTAAYSSDISTINNCFTSGSVEGYVDIDLIPLFDFYIYYAGIGGLIGYADRTFIHSCYSESSVIGQDAVAGLVGRVNSGTTILNCYTNSIINGNSRVGGLVGFLGYSSQGLKNGYSISSVNGNKYVGGIYGKSIGSSVRGCFSVDSAYLNMQDSTLYLNSGWDFVNIWSINDSINNGYPYLKMNTDTVPGYNDNNITLPVELTSFTAITTSNNYSQISWSTASETNLLGYNIYRNDNENIDTAIRINTTYIQATNSSNGSQYSYTDQEVEMNSTYYYWLESTEINGFTEFFGPVLINFSDQADDNNEVILVSELKGNYPNPFNPETTFHFFVKTGETAEFTIFNLKGQIVNSILFETGEHKYIWKGTDKSGKKVASGIYLYKLKTESYQSVKKMIMMK